jgi:hypothetical protein
MMVAQRQTPNLSPLPEWDGEDAFVIGGGSSLERFDFDQLIGKNTIGCNQAFLLGAERCNVAIFGDGPFWFKYEQQLKNKYRGWVVTYYQGLVESGTSNQSPQWVHCFPRQDRGLAREALGWNLNTGAAAINLALILGAQRVLLLGFDCCRTTKTHWHDLGDREQNEQSYSRFMEGFSEVAYDLPTVFPGRQVFNVSDGTSKLTAFPILKIDEVFSKEGAVV